MILSVDWVYGCATWLTIFLYYILLLWDVSFMIVENSYLLHLFSYLRMPFFDVQLVFAYE